MKIFISPFKGGTTSYAKALEMLGFNGLGHVPELFSSREYALIDQINIVVREYDNPDDIPIQIKSFIFESTQFIRDASREYNYFDDWPIGHDCLDPFVKEIIFENPKYILLDRELNKWINSVVKHENKYEGVRSFKWKMDDSCVEFMSFYRYKIFSRYLKIYKKDPTRVLITNSYSWIELCEFLGCEILCKEFPHENKS